MFLFRALMHGYPFNLKSTPLTALAAGLLWWVDRKLLCVSDLHLGKSERMARRGGSLLPPYENKDTLTRLAIAVNALNPVTVICLGDSFDDLEALDGLNEEDHTTLAAMMGGRRWIWIEGNHDAGPVNIGGTHLAEFETGPLTFRHIAQQSKTGEISGHYHPKASVKMRSGSLSRPCFLIDDSRVILPAFGSYTGGLKSTDPAFAPLMADPALAVLTGSQALPIPMPR
jgi:DNA ligase-associated metallophosphoesterase